MKLRAFAFILFLNPFLGSAQAEPVRVTPAAKGLLPTEKLPGAKVWVHDAIKGPRQRIVVWFEEQFLGDDKAFVRRAREFDGWKRRELRAAVVKTLKAASDRSYQAAKKDLDSLLVADAISDLERHWIVNGFTCRATPEGVGALRGLKGVAAIFAADPHVRPKVQASRFFPDGMKRGWDADAYKHPWYTRSLLAYKTWKELGVAGQGTLSVVHDFNFVFSDNVVFNLYRNPKEIPGNGKDDDGNGLVDDFHGYNFNNDSPGLTMVPVEKDAVNPQAMHGFMCAAIMCGAGVRSKDYEFGLAPQGKWAGVIAGPRIEAAVEWAIERGADTYSMSFSRPGLGEFRSHWRKIMEHGAFCGICFVTGAGNFAQTEKTPVQMRIPEDIPHAVFAATGVQRDFSRTPFSSMGPVKWKTAHYQDGLIDKPEVCAFNAGLPLLKLDGSVVPVAINGNSFAGPMVGGSLLLMMSADPDLLPWDARTILMSTATDVSKKGFDYETGHGLINCYRAVKEALRRKAVREGKDAKRFEGRETGDTLDIPAVVKQLQPQLRVGFVQPKGEAARAGVMKGDVLVSYNGDSITNQESLMNAKKKADDANLAVVLRRAEQKLTVDFASGPLGIVPVIEFAAAVFE